MTSVAPSGAMSVRRSSWRARVYEMQVEERVAIQVGSGLGFTVSASLFDTVKREAALTHKVRFIGVLPDGEEVSSYDREVLLDAGCQEIAWVMPEAQIGGAA